MLHCSHPFCFAMHGAQSGGVRAERWEQRGGEVGRWGGGEVCVLGILLIAAVVCGKARLDWGKLLLCHTYREIVERSSPLPRSFSSFISFIISLPPSSTALFISPKAAFIQTAAAASQPHHHRHCGFSPQPASSLHLASPLHQ